MTGHLLEYSLAISRKHRISRKMQLLVALELGTRAANQEFTVVFRSVAISYFREYTTEVYPNWAVSAKSYIFVRADSHGVCPLSFTIIEGSKETRISPLLRFLSRWAFAKLVELARSPDFLIVFPNDWKYYSNEMRQGVKFMQIPFDISKAVLRYFSCIILHFDEFRFSSH